VIFEVVDVALGVQPQKEPTERLPRLVKHGRLVGHRTFCHGSGVSAVDGQPEPVDWPVDVGEPFDLSKQFMLAQEVALIDECAHHSSDVLVSNRLGWPHEQSLPPWR